MEQIDLNQVRTFIRLVQSGSFTKAAELLRQPKSRISRKLASLEHDLGIQLIYRTTRQFQLTDAGRAYYEKCRSLVEGLESLSAEMSEATADVSGLIKITASDDVGVAILPEVLTEFTKMYPRIRFELMLSQAYIDLVKESVDVALRIGNLKDSSLRVKKVTMIRNILVASPGFLERYRQADDIDNIETIPFLALNNLSKLELWRLSDNKKMTVKMNTILSANNPAMIVKMATMGKGIAMVPEFLCADYLRSGSLIQIHKGWRGSEGAFSIVTPEQKEVPPKVKKFIEFAAKRLKQSLEQI